jgi:hypothetical protein
VCSAGHKRLFISLQPDFASSLLDGVMLEIVLRGIGDKDMFYSQPRKSVGIGQVEQAMIYSIACSKLIISIPLPWGDHQRYSTRCLIRVSTNSCIKTHGSDTNSPSHERSSPASSIPLRPSCLPSHDKS